MVATVENIPAVIWRNAAELRVPGRIKTRVRSVYLNLTQLVKGLHGFYDFKKQKKILLSYLIL